METKQIEQEIRNLNDKVNHLEFASAPINIFNQIKEITDTIGTLYSRIGEIDIRIEKMITTKIDAVTNEELLRLWKDSGVKIKEIAARFNIELQTASNWVHGNVADVQKRSDLKRFLQEKLNGTV